MLFALFADNAYAQTMLKVVIMDTYPWGFLDEEQNPTGIYYDFAKQIIEESGVTAEFMIVPYARAITYLETGQADITLMYSNARLKKSAVEVATIVEFENVILWRADCHYTSLQDFHGKIVGRLREAKYDNNFESDTAIEKFDVNTYSQLVQMLMLRRLDGIVGLKEGFYFNAKELGYKRELFGEPLVLNRNNFILHLSKNCSDLDIVSQKLRTAIHTLKSQNVFQAILEQWLKEE